jgi:small subunit ribosomal protein S7
MTRRKKDFERKVLPDPKYGDVIITKFVNQLMKHGKKSVAESALYDAFAKIAEKTSEDSINAFHQALENVRPVVEVRARRVGGATYQVPTEVRPKRADSLAIRWLIAAANSRSERTIANRLALEIIDAKNGRGIAVKRREDAHKMAEANKAFSHFRW